jgi:D-methionine transport system ATP-binding protein
MAILENGMIAENGPVKNVFNAPKSDTAKLFLKIDTGFVNFGWEGGGGI